jgi:hypothetical protein
VRLLRSLAVTAALLILLETLFGVKDFGTTLQFAEQVHAQVHVIGTHVGIRQCAVVTQYDLGMRMESTEQNDR